ncbi:MAG TPA: DUF58 domain-containing protein [Solirubrobacteraceae bacterium]|nr:DUF58 domain-containing protein [Solirubrobacteraceae bacterium]
MSPTPRVAGVLALAALSSLLLGPFVAAGGVLVVLGALVADARAARRPPPAGRDVPAVVARGRAVALRVTLPGAEAARARIRQAAPAGMTISPPVSDGALEADLLATRRGRHLLPAAAVRVRGPLGLAAWDHTAGEAHEVRVFPDVPAARRLALAVRQGRFREPGTRTRGPLGLGTEFESIRDGLPDDDVRFVNWRATARLGRSMVNNLRVEREREVVCVLDCGRLMASPVAESVTRLDAALDAATAVGLAADALGDRCGAVAFSDRVLRRLAPRRDGGEALVRACFDLEAEGVDSDPELAFRAVGGLKRALVLVLTDLVDTAAARSLVGAVPVLARHHQVVVADVPDPALRTAIATSPGTLDDVRAAAVAVEVERARTDAARRVRAAGAEVLDAPPGGLAAACVAAYVRAKARARL